MNHHQFKVHNNPQPAEIWGLWSTGQSKVGAHWVASMMETGDPVIIYLSEAEAIAGAKQHLDSYGIICEPRRIFSPATGPTEEALEEIVKLLASSINLVELTLHLPTLEHQGGRLNQLHTNLCGIVGYLGQRAAGVPFSGKPGQGAVAEAVTDADWDDDDMVNLIAPEKGGPV